MARSNSRRNSSPPYGTVEAMPTMRPACFACCSAWLPVLQLAAFELLFAIHVPQVVDRIADYGNVHAANIRRLQHILDGARWTALLRANILVELGASEIAPILRRKHVGMEVDDH